MRSTEEGRLCGERGSGGPRFPGMPSVNVNDRTSLERIYPADAYAADASDNARAKAEALRGLRIRSKPDENGQFEVERGVQHVGEAGDAAFLAPQHREQAREYARPDPDPRADYEAFLDDVVKAAREFGFEPADSPGRGDPRLHGLRQ
jgi:hypothetical protein